MSTTAFPATGVCPRCGTEFERSQRGQSRQRKWCSAACRRRQYDGPCVDCGAVCTGTRCAPCNHEHERYWTPQRVAATIAAWAEEHGRAPTAREWQQGSPPLSVTVAQRACGSWNAALVAAGLEPIAQGHKRMDYTATFRAHVAEHHRSTSKSLAQVARDFGLNDKTVARWVREARAAEPLDGPRT